jgi:hypothetical protein
MVLTKESEQYHSSFLHYIVQQFNFSRKKKEIFIHRFHPENKSLGNQELADKVYADDEIVDIAQSFQYHLNEICKELEKKGFQFRDYPHKGRPHKGESPWEQAFAWLWTAKFQEWRSEQVNYKSYESLDAAFEPQFYVNREYDENRCYKALREHGALIRIKGSQQIGKSWLMGKVLERLADEGYRAVSLSFKLADGKVHFNDIDKFLRWFCNNIILQLGLSNSIDEYWEESDLGSKVSCTIFIEELLKQAEVPLVLCLDDVDRMFPHPEVYEDFFALVRSWHEKAKSRKTLWPKLRMVVIHSTEVYIRLSINQSPFNVGLAFDLLEFSQQEIQTLTKQYGCQWDADQIKQLMLMIGGYPPLIQQTLSYLKIHPEDTLGQVLETAAQESGIYINHLRSHLLNLQQCPELASAFRQVVTATEAVRLKPTQTHQLLSLGLVTLSGNNVKPRCRLYRQYFCDRLEEI